MRPYYVLIAVSCLLLSCREKGTGEDTSGDLIQPPAGLVVSSPAGLLSSFNMHDGAVTIHANLHGASATAVTLNQAADRMFVTDASADRILIYRLPDLPLLSSFTVSGIPLDLELDAAATHAYVLTRNGVIWNYAISSAQFDSIDVSIDARQMCLLPPDRMRLWVACPHDRAVYEADLRTAAVTDTLYFEQPPYDVCFQSDGSIAFVCTAVSVHLISTEDMNLVDTFTATGATRDLAVSENNQWLAAADSANGVSRVWDLHTGRSRDFLVPAPASAPRFDRRGDYLYVASVSTNQIFKFDLAGDDPVAVDTMQFTANLAAFALWEQTN